MLFLAIKAGQRFKMQPLVCFDKQQSEFISPPVSLNMGSGITQSASILGSNSCYIIVANDHINPELCKQPVKISVIYTPMTWIDGSFLNLPSNCFWGYQSICLQSDIKGVGWWPANAKSQLFLRSYLVQTQPSTNLNVTVPLTSKGPFWIH